MLTGITFPVKAGILSGTFYFSAALFATGVVMAFLPRHPDVQVLLFGVVSAACFFVPGLKYYRQRLRAAAGALT